MGLKIYDNVMRGVRRKSLEWRVFSYKKYLILFVIIVGLAVISGWLLGGKYGERVGDYLQMHGQKISISAGLEVQTVTVLGVRNTPASLLEEALNHLEGQALYFLNINGLRMNLEELGWLETATVRRIFPNSLEIKVKEYVPKAIWQLNKKHHLIGSEGNIISDNFSDDFLNLPLVVGEGANLKLQELEEILSGSDLLKERFVGAIRVGERRWDIILGDIKLDDDIVVKLPQKGMVRAWRNLHRLAREELLLEHENIDVLDMRIRGRLIIKFRNGENIDFPYRDGDGA